MNSTGCITGSKEHITKIMIFSSDFVEDVLYSVDFLPSLASSKDIYRDQNWIWAI